MEVEDRTLLFTTRIQQRKIDDKDEAVLFFNWGSSDCERINGKRITQ